MRIGPLLVFLSLPAAAGAARDAAPARPAIIEPASWGSRPGDMSGEPTQNRFAWITLHHASELWTSRSDAVKFICAVQRWGQSPPDPPRKAVWPDLPYHFMIAPDGRIFGARPLQYQPATNTRYDVAENVTIELMGDFERQRPRREQLAAAVRLTAWLAAQYRIPLDHVRGHKDAPGADGTDCPGKGFYRYLVHAPGRLSLFQRWVGEVLDGKRPSIDPGPALSGGPKAVSPPGVAAGSPGALLRCP